MSNLKMSNINKYVWCDKREECEYRCRHKIIHLITPSDVDCTHHPCDMLNKPSLCEEPPIEKLVVWRLTNGKV